MRIRLRELLIVIAVTAAVTLLVGKVFSIPLRSGHKSITRSGVNSVSDAVLKMAQARARFADQRSSKKGDDGQLITATFHRCDEDSSSSLSIKETEACIKKEVKQHLTQALQENFFVFTALDTNPRNGAVSWQEHVTHYLRKKGYEDNFIMNHIDSVKGLKRDEKESLMRDKAAWSEAARDDPENLSLDEFLAFKHPESSHANILSQVDELLGAFDVDEDGALTAQEYTEADFDEQDLNKDGKIDRKELVLYRDPRHEHHSAVAATQLFAAVDSNDDKLLTLDELLEQPRLVATSKLVDAAASFHNTS